MQAWYISVVPIVAIVRTESATQIRQLVDPTDGTFDAAGDFDRLIPGYATGLLAGVDPYADTVFNAVQAPAVAREAEQLLLREDLTAIERRGLLRLAVLAEYVSAAAHCYLWFIGD